jgi:hypothetical protein
MLTRITFKYFALKSCISGGATRVENFVAPDVARNRICLVVLGLNVTNTERVCEEA